MNTFPQRVRPDPLFFRGFRVALVPAALLWGGIAALVYYLV